LTRRPGFHEQAATLAIRRCPLRPCLATAHSLRQRPLPVLPLRFAEFTRDLFDGPLLGYKRLEFGDIALSPIFSLIFGTRPLSSLAVKANNAPS